MKNDARHILRTATQSDLVKFWGHEKMLAITAACSAIKASCIDLDGRIIAVGGFALSEWRWNMFLDLKEEARRYKMLLMREAFRMIERMKSGGVRFIYVYPDLDEPKAMAWLARLGFEANPHGGEKLRLNLRGRNGEG